MKRGAHRLIAAAALVLGAMSAAFAANPMLAEVEINAAGRAERNAGVWVDGQYVGHVRQLRGKSRLALLPGRHELLFKLVGYEDVRREVTLEPGERYAFRLSMQERAALEFPAKEQTASIVLDVAPKDAAVFVNDRYAGHVNRFNGGRGMRLRAGTYRLKITLPGYKPFETEVKLEPNQRYEIRTALAKGTIAEQDEELMVRR